MNFEQLTPAEKRVAIAQDVIASIKTNQFKPKAGDYLNLDLSQVFDRKASVQELLNTGTTCSVCAVGACFVSLVRFENKFTVEEYAQFGFHDDGVSIGKARARLMEYFDRKTLYVIEGIFERDVHYLSRSGVNMERSMEIINDFYDGESWSNAKEALLKIMQNIIDNQGDFIP